MHLQAGFIYLFIYLLINLWYIYIAKFPPTKKEKATLVKFTLEFFSSLKMYWEKNTFCIHGGGFRFRVHFTQEDTFLIDFIMKMESIWIFDPLQIFIFSIILFWKLDQVFVRIKILQIFFQLIPNFIKNNWYPVSLKFGMTPSFTHLTYGYTQIGDEIGTNGVTQPWPYPCATNLTFSFPPWNQGVLIKGFCDIAKVVIIQKII